MSSTYDLTPESIYKYDKKTLETICRSRKLKVSGNKSELQTRILESVNGQTSLDLTPQSQPPQSTDETKKIEYDESPEAIYKYDKKTLEAICRLKKLKISGKKEELQTRILQATGQISKENKIKESPVKTTTKKTTPPKKKKTTPPVVQKLEEKTHTYNISRNKWGNYEHLETQLVFNPETKTVYGRQTDSENVVELTTEDIELCKKYKFPYTLPTNLNLNKNSEIEVEELTENIEEVLALKEDEDDDEFDDIEEDDEVI